VSAKAARQFAEEHEIIRMKEMLNENNGKGVSLYEGPFGIKTKLYVSYSSYFYKEISQNFRFISFIKFITVLKNQSDLLYKRNLLIIVMTISITPL